MLCAFIVSALVGPIFGVLAMLAYLSGVDRDGIIHSIHMDSVVFIWPIAAYIAGDWGSWLENISVYILAATINIATFMILYLLIELSVKSRFVFVLYGAFVAAVFLHGYYIGEFTSDTRSPYSWILPLFAFSVPVFYIVERRN